MNFRVYFALPDVVMCVSPDYCDSDDGVEMLDPPSNFTLMRAWAKACKVNGLTADTRKRIWFAHRTDGEWPWYYTVVPGVLWKVKKGWWVD